MHKRIKSYIYTGLIISIFIQCMGITLKVSNAEQLTGAFEKAAKQAGSTIEVQPGTYQISESTLPSNTTLSGSATDEVIFKGSGAKYILSCDSNTTIKNIHIQLTSDNPAGILIKKKENVTLKNLLITGEGKQGIECSHSKKISMQESILCDQEYGILLNQCTSVNIKENMIINHAFCAIYVHKTQGTVEHNIIANNKTYGIFSVGTQKYYLRLFAKKDLSYEDNYYQNNGKDSTANCKNLLDTSVKNVDFITIPDQVKEYAKTIGLIEKIDDWKADSKKNNK